MRNIFAIIFCIFETFLEIIEPGFRNRDWFSWVRILVEAFWEACHSWELTAWDQRVIHSLYVRIYLSISIFTFKLWDRLRILDRFISQHTFDHILWGSLVDLVVMDTSVSSNHCGCIHIPNISAQCAKVLYLLYTTSTLCQGRLKTGVSDPSRTSVISPRPRNHLRCRT